jgi:hypothetical protein
MRPQGLFITEAPMASREAVNLREYFERLLADHERRHEREAVTAVRALEEAKERIDQRATASGPSATGY